MEQNQYTTILAPASGEYEEKKSVFYGYIAPVTSPEEAAEVVARRRTEYHDARHHVYAYLLRDGRKRYSDDGGPHGTAGLPVLEVLQGAGLSDVVVVVTRYFGGVLLGTGGLTRSYGKACRAAVEAAGKKTRYWCWQVELSLDYALYGKIQNLLPRYRARVTDSRFEELVMMSLLIHAEDYQAFETDLIELTAAAVLPKKLGQIYASLPV